MRQIKSRLDNIASNFGSVIVVEQIKSPRLQALVTHGHNNQSDYSNVARKRDQMIQQLPEMSLPSWLANLSADTILDGPFPLKRILSNSLYYPSSGFDGDPIRYLAGNILSFVYVDYGHSHDEFQSARMDPGFLGYELIATRPVTQKELAPKGSAASLSPSEVIDPSLYEDRAKSPFCSWSVFQRSETVSSNHGPERFSLLYHCAEGVAAFQTLYVANSLAPKAVAIIEPGLGFGGNWTDFTDPHQIFARSVLENLSGQPEILLFGGHGARNLYRDPCWPMYRNHVCYVEKTEHGSIGVWANETH